MRDKKELNKIHVYMYDRAEEVRIKRRLATVAGQKLCVCFHDSGRTEWPPACPGAVRETAAVADSLCGRRGCPGDRDLEREGALYLTDMPKWAAQLAAAGYPVLGYMHESGGQETFDGVAYVIEGFGDVEEDYFIKVYQRLTGQPWHILDTPRCKIRETVEEDVDAFYRIYKDPSITEFMEGLFEDREEELRYTRDYREKVYAFYGFGMWTVVLKATGEVIGRAGLSMREGFEVPELGFLIGVPWQGRGLALEVCRAVLAYGLEELGFGIVQTLVEEGNKPSLDLCRKLGFDTSEEIRLDGKAYIRMLANFKISD